MSRGSPLLADIAAPAHTRVARWQRVLRFVRFEAEQYLLRRRWFLPVPVSLFLAYLVINDIHVRNLNYSFQANAWDVLFNVFGSIGHLFYVFLPLFIYLISDLMPEPPFTQAVLPRLGSRRLWWLGKILTLTLAVLLFLAMLVGSVAAVASFVLPWQSDWSMIARYPFGPSEPDALFAASPLLSLGQLVILLILGLLSIGLLMMLIAQLAHRSIFGFLAGAFVLLSGLVAWKGGIEPPYTALFIGDHFFSTARFIVHHRLGNALAAPIPLSVLYWTTWITVFGLLGLRLSRRHDFVAGEGRAWAVRGTPFLRLLTWNLGAAWRLWWVPATIGLFLLLGWGAAGRAAAYVESTGAGIPANMWDGLYIAFAGPGSGAASLPGWLAIHLLFFYATGDLANGELQRHGYGVVPQVGSRGRWWRGKVAVLLVLALGYGALGILATIAGSLIRLPWSWQGSELVRSGDLAQAVELSPAALVTLTFLLFAGTLFALATFQAALAVTWRSSIYSLTAIAVILILSWLLGADNRELIRWLPGSQSMLLRHTLFNSSVPGFSLGWSYLYNALLALLAIGFGAWRVRRLDIVASSAAEAR